MNPTVAKTKTYHLSFSKYVCSKAKRSPRKLPALAFASVTLSRGRVVNTIYAIFIPLFRDRVPQGRIVFSRRRDGGEVRKRREEPGGRRALSPARKSGAFHALFMKYIFQQNSHRRRRARNLVPMRSSEPIDANVCIRNDAKNGEF